MASTFPTASWLAARDERAPVQQPWHRPGTARRSQQASGLCCPKGRFTRTDPAPVSTYRRRKDPDRRPDHRATTGSSMAFRLGRIVCSKRTDSFSRTIVRAYAVDCKSPMATMRYRPAMRIFLCWPCKPVAGGLADPKFPSHAAPAAWRVAFLPKSSRSRTSLGTLHVPVLHPSVLGRSGRTPI